MTEMPKRIKGILAARRAATLASACLALTALVRSQASGPDPLQAMQFRFIGPPGNRINAVEGVAGDPNVIYAGTPSGGIFKTVDGGLHWQPIFDDQMVASIGALAVARSNADIVWAGTGDANMRQDIEIGDGVYKSIDAGKTWSHMGLDSTGRIGRIAVDPRNPSTVFVAAMGHCYGPQQERGVFRTRDGGKSWDRVLFVDENTGAIDVAIDPADPRIVFAATWQFRIYPWFSENGGPGSGIYVSRNGGATWRHLSCRGLPSAPLGRIALAIAPSNAKRIYALIETADQGSLWRSDDGGETWRVASHDAALNRGGGPARYFSRLGVHPSNSDEVYFLTKYVYRSLDGGATSKIVPGLAIDHHDIWFDPLNADRMIVANDRYVNISATRGTSWFHVNLPNAQIMRVAMDRRIPYNVYGSRQDGPSYRGPSNSFPAENGTNLIPPDFWIWTIGDESGWGIPDRTDDNIVWVSSDRTVRHIDMRTGAMLGASPWIEDAGASKVFPVANRLFRRNWTIPLAMSPHNPRKIYAGSQYVHESADGGQTWAIISPDLTTDDKSKQQIPPGLWPATNGDVVSTLIAIEESPIELGVIWTGSNDGVVSLTRDGGKNWTNVSKNIPGLEPWGYIYSVAPSRHAVGAAYVTVDRHRAADNATYVFKTEDYGRTWKAIGSGIPKNVFAYARVVREDPRRKGMLYLGTENGLYVSFDDGASWRPLQNNLPHAPIAWLGVQEDLDDLVVATWGRGIWILDDIAPLQQLGPDVMRERAHLFAPRPAYLFGLRRPSTTESFAADYDPPSTAGHNPPYGAPINYYLGAAAGDVRLTILDEKGKSVRTIAGTRAPGLNRVWWDLRGGAEAGRGPANPLVAPGTYVVRLSVDGQESAAKVPVRNDPVGGER